MDQEQEMKGLMVRGDSHGDVRQLPSSPCYSAGSPADPAAPPPRSRASVMPSPADGLTLVCQWVDLDPTSERPWRQDSMPGCRKQSV